MKIVLDTNVLVSGLLKSHSHAGTIVRMVAGGLLQVVYDARILTEYREVLSRPKFGFEKREIEAIVSQIEAEGILAVGQPLPEKLPDPDDEPFLEVALAIEGTILVTGNKKHFAASAAQKVAVLNPGEFVS
ncbi:MAG: putative toxin-antitoxin system toxin component, PIN family, partial [Thermoanaerobacteraceae bacterium]|nr:putative toxin-antitoxin system toxin component, PIN family [Thermoanaerobacteraceae bacterium]